ncbi:alginate export family protein [Flavivirga abyssicola]|uniref:alginate export family protein n=1 Tax=Flavivirga abyssicola TaxID=3063533 RepID=UPI0026DF42D6|nr:alginate export family protein [Flavivirga sp. MEBiC07777]WVK13846.1 alginate export family protein [Flavivirga sp. MEBiC07777]
MKTITLLIIGLLISKGVYTQEIGEYFSLLRQNDNTLVFKNQEKNTWYSSLKYMPINKEIFMSFGGSWRFQYESFVNEQFQNIDNQDRLWFFNRALLHGYLNIKNKLEVFAELNSSLVTNKEDVSPVDKNVLAFNQLFLKYHFNNNWCISIGRENLEFGARRLVDIREGPNVRRSFDLAQVNFSNYKFSVKGFFAIPVKPRPEVFDNDFLQFDETFSGLYTTTRFNKSNNLDAYVFYQKDDNVMYNNGSENERRVSIGARYFGTYKSLVYNNELVYQFGDFGNQNIKAWTLSFQLENKTNLFNHNFNTGLKTEIISGDKAENDNSMNTFDALYPRGAYFGRVARFGPSNLIDIHPYINTNFNDLFIEIDYDAFWRYSTNDGVYNAALLLEYPDTNNEKFIANQFGAIVGYEFNRHINIELEYNIIFPGAFLKESARGATLNHFVFTTEVKF